MRPFYSPSPTSPRRSLSRSSFAAMPASAALTCASCWPCSRSNVRQCMPFGFRPLPFRMPGSQSAAAGSRPPADSPGRRRLRGDFARRGGGTGGRRTPGRRAAPLPAGRNRQPGTATTHAVRQSSRLSSQAAPCSSLAPTRRRCAGGSGFGFGFITTRSDSTRRPMVAVSSPLQGPRPLGGRYTFRPASPLKPSGQSAGIPACAVSGFDRSR